MIHPEITQTHRSYIRPTNDLNQNMRPGGRWKKLQRVLFSTFSWFEIKSYGNTGKIAQTSLKSNNANNAAQLRLNRRNNAKQVQVKKHAAIVSATRIFSGIDGIPRIVAVIPLSEDIDTKNLLGALAETMDISADDCPQDGLWRMRCVTSSEIQIGIHFSRQGWPIQNLASVQSGTLQKFLWCPRRMQGSGLCHVRSLTYRRSWCLGWYTPSFITSSRSTGSR